MGLWGLLSPYPETTYVTAGGPERSNPFGSNNLEKIKKLFKIRVDKADNNSIMEHMTDKCKYCGKEVKGQEKYRGAEITHAACIYKAMAPIRAKVTQFRKGK